MQRNKTPIIYYTNLLIATVIQICTMIMMVSKPDDRKISNTSSLVFYCAVMANLYFKVCIALERYLSFSVCTASGHWISMCSIFMVINIVYCDNLYSCLSCIAGICSSPAHCWTASGKLRVLCCSVFWSGLFVLSVFLLPHSYNNISV